MARKMLVPMLAAALVAAFGLSAVAQAHGVKHRGFYRTYPVAGKLCFKADAGTLPASLQPQAAAIKAACTTLQNSLTAAKTAYKAAVDPLRQQAKDALAALATTCEQARASGDWTACRTAWQSTKATLSSIHTQVKAAAKTYHDAVVAARKAFWATVKPLLPTTPATVDTNAPSAAPVSLPAIPSPSRFGWAWGWGHAGGFGHGGGHGHK